MRGPSLRSSVAVSEGIRNARRNGASGSPQILADCGFSIVDVAMWRSFRPRVDELFAVDAEARR